VKASTLTTHHIRCIAPPTQVQLICNAVCTTAYYKQQPLHVIKEKHPSVEAYKNFISFVHVSFMYLNWSELNPHWNPSKRLKRFMFTYALKKSTTS
jgi:hypothetical protein